MSQKSGSNTKKGILISIWVVIWLPVIIIALILLMIWNGWLGFMPTFEELENPKSNLASEIYSEDGKILGTYYIQNRSNIHFEDLSPNIVNALVATEDARFFKHSGIDFRSILRVIFKNIVIGNKSAGGGSTLSQQLAKNLFPRESNLNRMELVIIKLKEWLTAIKLERNYTKKEIIAMYLNTVDFGSQSFGIKSATRTFFDKEANQLSIPESALLVGLLKAPTYFSPVRNPERSVKRREVVLAQMKKYKYITEEQYNKYKDEPLDMSKYEILDHNVGHATYFREYLREYLTEWCKNHKKEDGSVYNIYKDGLKIYTTINSKMQKYAEESVREVMKDLQITFFKHWKGIKNAPFDRELKDEDIEKIIHQSIIRSDRYILMKRAGKSDKEITKAFNTPVKMRVFSWNGEIDTIMTPKDSIFYYKYFLLTGFMAMDSESGQIRAYVGGINYKHFKYDHVIKGKRQVGSTFKPFVYTLAMQEGEFSPCTKVPNVSVSFDLYNGEKWTPKNSDDAREGEMVTLKWALANSINYVSAYLMKRYSPESVISIARKMGVKSYIEPVYSICLGTADISLYEMVGAYNTFVNKGQWVEPVFLTQITDKYGHVLEKIIPKRNEAISEETAYLMISLMKGVVEGGTSVRLRYKYKLTNPIAGKTGTTQNNSDGWFIGLTPEISGGAWVGCDDRSVHFRSITLGQGANTALPIWGLFMQKVYEDKSLNIEKDIDFQRPASKISVELDCAKYEQNKSTDKKKFKFDNDGF
ncbi:MAG: hypothetical protein A2X12_04020 [Bacteroidetes bacterium GWE2_29_8]|nr:MAG: hypothetical protein A2X12_04020 [Bacteroidetes bacterium GWE2_29_8]OFY13770.1 MAG: hypothetical protein A2X02_00600 [Bacteroidetes bacterium GWF2_29_10]